ncbi:uncharacterized protein TNIN_252211 [Trichonephila inaurata madagascariensis]|uniref:Uncharacterized protein n=1 Tax=Trichonephila inaurata madagascariensis TaxID=2747483 RepID=A0A8X7BNB7_9ARAC|nr:uncharacterized protein TNIN_252211 [Trichonephila inaurata madagascariensis]
MATKCNGVLCAMDLQELYVWRQYFMSMLNDIFGLNNPMCVARGVLFFSLLWFMAVHEGIHVLISLPVSYLAFYFVGGKEFAMVMYRSLGRDLR